MSKEAKSAARPRTDTGNGKGKPRPRPAAPHRNGEGGPGRSKPPESFVKQRFKGLGQRIAQSEWVQRAVVGVMRFVFKWARYVGRERASRIASRVARWSAPLARENTVGRENLAAAFPEKSAAEREAILTGVWDNLARFSMEYAFFPELVAAFDLDRPTGGLIEHVGLEYVAQIRDSGKPAIIFGCHIGNWELPAAIGRKMGLPLTALYRPPANPFVAEEIERVRGNLVGTLVVSGRGAARRVASALQKGECVGIIVDQRINDAPLVTFFGRPSASNPIIGMMARLFNCPVHGTRGVRLPDDRFRIEMTPPLDLPRDAKGRVDAEATNVMVHGVIENWIREAPEQWLWLHDRWRLRHRPHRTRWRQRDTAD